MREDDAKRILNQAIWFEDLNEEEKITCAVCGLGFYASQHRMCSGCPLHSKCTMSCCPNCGVTSINTNRSVLVGWVKKLLTGGSHVSPK